MLMSLMGSSIALPFRPLRERAQIQVLSALDQFLGVPVMTARSFDNFFRDEFECFFVSLGLLGPLFGAQFQDALPQLVHNLISASESPFYECSVDDVLRSRAALLLVLEPMTPAMYECHDTMAKLVLQCQERLTNHCFKQPLDATISLSFAFDVGTAGHVTAMIASSSHADVWHPCNTASVGRVELLELLRARTPLWTRAQEQSYQTSFGHDSMGQINKTGGKLSRKQGGQGKQGKRRDRKMRPETNEQIMFEQPAKSSKPYTALPLQGRQVLETTRATMQEQDRLEQGRMHQELLRLQELANESRQANEKASEEAKRAKKENIVSGHTRRLLEIAREPAEETLAQTVAPAKNRSARRRERNETMTEVKHMHRARAEQANSDALFLRQSLPAMRPPRVPVPEEVLECSAPASQARPRERRKLSSNQVAIDLQRALWDAQLLWPLARTAVGTPPT